MEAVLGCLDHPSLLAELDAGGQQREVELNLEHSGKL